MDAADRGRTRFQAGRKQKVKMHDTSLPRLTQTPDLIVRADAFVCNASADCVATATFHEQCNNRAPIRNGSFLLGLHQPNYNSRANMMNL